MDSHSWVKSSTSGLIEHFEDKKDNGVKHSCSSKQIDQLISKLSKPNCFLHQTRERRPPSSGKPRGFRKTRTGFEQTDRLRERPKASADFEQDELFRQHLHGRVTVPKQSSSGKALFFNSVLLKLALLRIQFWNIVLLDFPPISSFLGESMFFKFFNVDRVKANQYEYSSWKNYSYHKLSKWPGVNLKYHVLNHIHQNDSNFAMKVAQDKQSFDWCFKW
jgi:hypothetical protein